MSSAVTQYHCTVRVYKPSRNPGQNDLIGEWAHNASTGSFSHITNGPIEAVLTPRIFEQIARSIAKKRAKEGLARSFFWKATTPKPRRPDNQ